MNSAADFMSGFELKKCYSNVWPWKHVEWSRNRKIIRERQMLSNVACKILWAAKRQMQDFVLNIVLLGKKERSSELCITTQVIKFFLSFSCCHKKGFNANLRNKVHIGKCRRCSVYSGVYTSTSCVWYSEDYYTNFKTVNHYTDSTSLA